MPHRALPHLPPLAGISFKPEHGAELLRSKPALGFVEVHAENYLGAGGPMLKQLHSVREMYPLSIHGVGLSIGGEDALDTGHLDRIKALMERFEPVSFSEHLAWSSHGPFFFNDLLPIAYDLPTLLRVCEHIDQVQNHFGRALLLENPSTYLAFERSTMSETDFIGDVARRTGCGLLLDVNNVQVTAVNHNLDPIRYLHAFPMEHVREIHLAGYAEDHDNLGDRVLIDAHDRPVQQDVWSLYDHVLSRTGPIASLIEWDNDVPELAILLAEAAKAQARLANQPAAARFAA
jgi:uncharacterized protein